MPDCRKSQLISSQVHGWRLLSQLIWSGPAIEVMPALGVQPGVVVPEAPGEAVGWLTLVQELAQELEERRNGFDVGVGCEQVDPFCWSEVADEAGQVDGRI
jgi:hypothetical protein